MAGPPLPDVPIDMHPYRWGDPAHESRLPTGARALVEAAFGITEQPVADAKVPRSALSAEARQALAAVVGPAHVLTDDATRMRRTHGRSTIDLLRLRAGDLADAPDAVVRPDSHDQVLAVLRCAVEHRLAVVTFGGGTSVTGGLAARRTGFAGLICLDVARMRRLLALDRESMTATLEPGLRGPEAEALLAAEGLMLGHYPQSFEFATVGGFAATRSSGQSSAGYGRFDDLVVALRVATPSGEVHLGRAPRSAAGPDLRHLFLGSEGALGVLTEVTVRVRPLPAARVYEGWGWPDFDTGAEAARVLAQADLLPTVLRISDETESAINLARPDEIGDGGGADPGGGSSGCAMVVGFEGTEEAVAARRAAVTAVLESLGGTLLGTEPGEAWAAGRFSAPYLRDALLDLGVLVETLETATWWSRRREVYAAVRAALTEALPGALLLCHVSHVYATGCSLYFTVAARESDDPIGQWTAAKRAASEAMVALGATITHHHAVGTDHRPWLEQEIGPLGVGVLRAVKADLDPAGVLNPGVLIP